MVEKASHLTVAGNLEKEKQQQRSQRARKEAEIIHSLQRRVPSEQCPPKKRSYSLKFPKPLTECYQLGLKPSIHEPFVGILHVETITEPSHIYKPSHIPLCSDISASCKPRLQVLLHAIIMELVHQRHALIL